MNAGHFAQFSDCWSSEEQPDSYYRTAAARARRLQADVTTPRVKQYLDKMIAHCEGLAGKCATTIIMSGRIASPEMLSDTELLPHLICSPPIGGGGDIDEAGQHGSTR